MRLLLIDDDSELRFALAAFLISQGYEVEQAENGQEGLDLATNYRYDLIITDFDMPKHHGLSFIKHYRQQDQTTPIVMFSGSYIADIAIQTGANAYVDKPDHETLLRTIRTLLADPPEAA